MNTEAKSALKVLEETSRTFYIPIVKLPGKVQEAVASAYLCLRAIDQVQDHPTMPNALKSTILKNISYSLQKFGPNSSLQTLQFDWAGQQERLAEVTLRLA